MDFSYSQLGILWAAVGLASFVHGTIGFASGLLLLPILVFAGWTLPEAIGINLVAGIVQNTYGAFHLRREIQWREWVRPNLVRLTALPLGVWALTYADRLDTQTIRQIVGAVILTVLVAFWLWRVKPREHLHVGWEFLAMTASGFFAGLCGIGGPQMVLWLSAQVWPPHRARAFLFVAFACTLVPHAALLVWHFDERATTALAMGLASLPAAMAGVAAGITLGGYLPREPLRLAMLGALTVVSALAVVAPLL